MNVIVPIYVCVGVTVKLGSGVSVGGGPGVSVYVAVTVGVIVGVKKYGSWNQLTVDEPEPCPVCQSFVNIRLALYAYTASDRPVFGYVQSRFPLVSVMFVVWSSPTVQRYCPSQVI